MMLAMRAIITGRNCDHPVQDGEKEQNAYFPRILGPDKPITSRIGLTSAV